MVNSFSNKKGAMLPIMAMIMIVLGVGIGSILTVSSMNGYTQNRMEFRQQAIKTISEMDGFKLFYNELARLSIEKTLTTNFGSVDGACPERVANDADLQNKLKNSMASWISAYQTYNGNPIPEADIYLDVKRTDVVEQWPVGSNTQQIEADLPDEHYVYTITYLVRDLSDYTADVDIEGVDSSGNVVCSKTNIDVGSPGVYTGSAFECYKKIKKVRITSDKTQSTMDFYIKVDTPDLGEYTISGVSVDPLEISKKGIKITTPGFFLFNYKANKNYIAPRDVIWYFDTIKGGTSVSEITLGDTVKLKANIHNNGCADSKDDVVRYSYKRGSSAITEINTKTFDQVIKVDQTESAYQDWTPSKVGNYIAYVELNPSGGLPGSIPDTAWSKSKPLQVKPKVLVDDSTTYTSSGSPGNSGTIKSYSLTAPKGKLRIKLDYQYYNPSGTNNDNAYIKIYADGNQKIVFPFKNPLNSWNGQITLGSFRTSNSNPTIDINYVNGDGLVKVRNIKIEQTEIQ